MPIGGSRTDTISPILILSVFRQRLSWEGVVQASNALYQILHNKAHEALTANGLGISKKSNALCNEGYKLSYRSENG